MRRDIKINHQDFTEEVKEILLSMDSETTPYIEDEDGAINYLLYLMLTSEHCTAYTMLSNMMFIDDIKKMCKLYAPLTKPRDNDGVTQDISGILEDVIRTLLDFLIEEGYTPPFMTMHLFLSLISTYLQVKEEFKHYDVYPNDITLYIKIHDKGIIEREEVEKEVSSSRPRTGKNISQKKAMVAPKRQVTHRMEKEDEVTRTFLNINELADRGELEEVLGNEGIIENIFTILNKRSKNNIILVGEAGVGKTATSKHIANLIVGGKVPYSFLNKKLIEIDIMRLVVNTPMRGSLESKVISIIEDAKSCGNYIFFFDDIAPFVNCKSQGGGDYYMSYLLERALNERRIQVLCTAETKTYKKLAANNAPLLRMMEVISLSPPTNESCKEILETAGKKLETFHKVTFESDAISKCIAYCRRYITERSLPDSAIDILDETASRIILNKRESIEIKKKREELASIEDRKAKMEGSSNIDYEEYDKLIRYEISLKSNIKLLEKEELFLQPIKTIAVNDIKSTLSRRTGIPLSNLETSNNSNLSSLGENIKKYVIGQEEAVNSVVRVIQKQRLGISNPDKPPVFLFVGGTGTGKTYLAKSIAKEMYGGEQYLVRLDMSEYGDKTSVTKLYGSSSGYVGYENGGILTEAVKNKKHCVILIDEIEKAHADVYNVFLQLFGEGRLTDNMGVTVDFKNTIIIMTSNIGTKEVMENGIGFMQEKKEERDRNITDKCLKRTFAPEFLNRVDKIVHFNSLSGDDIKKIIVLEVNKVINRISDIGYHFEEDFVSDKLIDMIYDNVKDTSYGARPITREVEKTIEDTVTNMILSGNIKPGYTFKLGDFER